MHTNKPTRNHASVQATVQYQKNRENTFATGGCSSSKRQPARISKRPSCILSYTKQRRWRINGRDHSTECPRHRQFQPLGQWLWHSGHVSPSWLGCSTVVCTSADAHMSLVSMYNGLLVPAPATAADRAFLINRNKRALSLWALCFHNLHRFRAATMALLRPNPWWQRNADLKLMQA